MTDAAVARPTPDPPEPTRRRGLRRIPTIWRVWIYATVVAIYSVAVVVYRFEHFASGEDDMPSDMHAMLGLMLSLLLVFRTNGAYDRWWEGRKVWGALVNVSRNLAVKVSTLANLDARRRGEFGRLLLAFPPALRDHLREGARLDRLPGFERSTENPGHVPAHLVEGMYRLLRAWQIEGRLGEVSFLAFDREAAQLLEQCGQCERIRNTRLPRSYRRFVAQCVVLYVLALPWGLVEQFELWTVPVTMIVSYFLIGVEVVAHSIEEPFGLDCDDLDLDGICATISRSVSGILAEAPHE